LDALPYRSRMASVSSCLDCLLISFFTPYLLWVVG
jgi:hypothetical protein